MKESPTYLQKKITDQIDEFCGIKELSKFLYRFQFGKTTSEKLQILSMLNYYESLYLYSVNVEDDCIDLRQAGLNILDFLNKEKCLKDCKYILFLIDLMNYGLEYTEKIKRLA